MTTIVALRDAHQRFDAAAVDFDEVGALLRRWIEGQTFAPRTGDRGVHVLDSASAPFGDFEQMQFAGLVDGEWPGRPRRNIFYSTGILKELGWPAERERANGARAASSLPGVIPPSPRASHAAKNCCSSSWMNRPRARGESTPPSSAGSSSFSTSEAKNLNGQSW